LTETVKANMTLIPKIYVDDEASSTALTTINSTNYIAGERNIVYKNLEIAGNHNFLLELNWSGSVLMPVALPILIDLETIDE